jgi:multidrug efflux pump subunit AcrA (membrane-fusion protein)
VVWVLGTDGALRAVPIRTGASDGKNTAVLEGELAEGDAVVTGIAGAAAGAAPAASRRMPGRFL